jgi:hypothetical protein
MTDVKAGGAMTQPIHYAGPIAADAASGLHGGTCSLSVAGGVFVLQLARHLAYGIEDADTVRGACSVEPGGYRLEARHWHSRTCETTTIESERPLASRWVARFAPPPAPREAAVELHFALAADAFDVLLLRQSGRDAPPDPALAAWFDDACAQRQAHRDAERERHARAQEHARRAAESTQAFSVKDYARVEALLAPIEDRLSPAERQRLAMARRHLGSA